MWRKEKADCTHSYGGSGKLLSCNRTRVHWRFGQTCWGENVIKDQKVEYLASNTEYLQSANPDIILRAAHGMPAEVVKMFDEEFKTNDIWKHFDAVKNNRVYDLDENLFGMTASLNAPEALKEMEKMLYDN